MQVEAGDTITIEAEKVGQTHRKGIVEEVLEHEPPRLRVRWDDGHTTVLAPSAGAATVERAAGQVPARQAARRSSKHPAP
jgi:uncharacterized protein DUF1918